MKVYGIATRLFLIHTSTRRKTIIRLALCLLLLCTNLPEITSAQAKKGKGEAACVPTRDTTILKSRENELRAVAEKLLQAFRAGDAKTFLGLVHPDYFSMGEDSKNYTRSELRESFRVKDEMYCYLFDASCIAPAPPPTTPETSFSEVAKRPGARVQSVQIWTGKGIKEPGCRGSVNFTWVDPVDSPEVSTFTFMYVDRQWKTVGFDFPPTATPKTSLLSPQAGWKDTNR
jgi:hypothetical protein